MAAKEALDEGNRLDAATGIGVSYEKYNDQLVDFAAKVNNVTAEIDTANTSVLIPGASDICMYISESLTHYTKARDHWYKQIKKQDTPKTERMLKLEWVAARAAIGLARDLLRINALVQGQEQQSDEAENASIAGRNNQDRLKHKADLASSNQNLEDMLKYGYSENEIARIIAYLDGVVWEARKWAEANEQMVVDPAGEPVERKFQRRRAALTAPLDALRKVLQATEVEAAKKRQEADANLKAAKVRADSNPSEPDLLRNAEEAHKRTVTQQNESIEIIQSRIQAELKVLNP